MDRHLRLSIFFYNPRIAIEVWNHKPLAFPSITVYAVTITQSFFHYVNWRQFTRLCRMPKSIHRVAHFILDEMQKSNPTVKPEIDGFLIVEWNGRQFRQLMDRTVNHAALPYKEVGHVDRGYSDNMEEPAGGKWKQ